MGFFGDLLNNAKDTIVNKAHSEVSDSIYKTIDNAKENAKYKCPKCKKKATEEDKFCQQCGAKLKETCKECNIFFPLGTKFCKECGKKL
ncbi:MAG: zinc ribbon domain-containing protein [archaeon]